MGFELHRFGLPARIRLQQSQGGMRLSHGDAREIFVLLRPIAGGLDGRARQQHRGKIRPRQKSAAHLLECDRHLHEAQAKPAVLFAEYDAGPTLVRHLLPQSRIEGRVCFHEAPDFADGAFGGEELAR